jgi:hypothetical protein
MNVSIRMVSVKFMVRRRWVQTIAFSPSGHLYAVGTWFGDHVLVRVRKNFAVKSVIRVIIHS